MTKAAFLLVLLSCQTVKDVGGEVGGTAAEWIACPTNLVDCGHVYWCDAYADNELGHVEICINDDDDPDALASAEAEFGDCEPTPRHQGLCIWCPSGAGCNAYNGCWGCP